MRVSPSGPQEAPSPDPFDYVGICRHTVTLLADRYRLAIDELERLDATVGSFDALAEGPHNYIEIEHAIAQARKIEDHVAFKHANRQLWKAWVRHIKAVTDPASVALANLDP